MNVFFGSLVFLSLVLSIHGQLEVLYEWVSLDYTWPSPEARQEAIDNGSYVVENNALAGIKVYNGDVYVTVPRWTPGVPSTLNKVITVDSQPLLQPYPSWEMQKPDDCSAFQFVQSMEIDSNTGYMWVIDTGRRNIFEWPPTNASINACAAKLVIININTNDIMHVHEFPEDVLTRDGNFVNDIVIDPDGGYAYMSDVGTGPELHPGGIIVYDINTGSSHRLQHISMQPEPQNINLTIGGSTYLFNTPVDGIALSPDKTLLHYCALGGKTVYQLATSVARDPDANLTAHVRALGVKPSQSDGLFMGFQRLYYGCLAGEECQSALAYWPYRLIMNQTGNGLDDLTMSNYTEFYTDPTTMGWPDTFSMDDQGYLWVVSNRLHEFTAREMDFSGASGSNFRVSRYPWPDDRSYLYKDHRTSGGRINYGDMFLVLFVLFTSNIAKN